MGGRHVGLRDPYNLRKRCTKNWTCESINYVTLYWRYVLSINWVIDIAKTIYFWLFYIWKEHLLRALRWYSRNCIVCVPPSTQHTTRSLQLFDKYLCVRIIWIIQCRITKIYIHYRYTYIYMYMPHTVYGTMPPKKIPNKTASSIVKKSVGDSARWQWETFASMQLTSASACKNFQSMCAMVDCPSPVHKTLKKSR